MLTLATAPLPWPLIPSPAALAAAQDAAPGAGAAIGVLQSGPRGPRRWPSLSPPCRSRLRPRRGIAGLSPSTPGGSRPLRCGRDMRRFGPHSRWPSTWGQRPAGAKCPWGVGCAAWSLAEDGVRVWARRRQDGVSRLTRPRGLATARVQRRDVNGWAMTWPGPPIAVADRVPRIPAHASRAVAVCRHPSGCFTRSVRLPSWGTVRSGVSGADEALTGRSVGLGTKRVDGSAAKSIGLSRHRWPTDTCDQDRQGQLGCTAYRRRRTDASGNHGCVGFVAASLRHVTGRPAVPDRTQGRMHTMGDACRPPGRALRPQRLICAHDPCSDGVTADHRLAQ